MEKNRNAEKAVKTMWYRFSRREDQVRHLCLFSRAIFFSGGVFKYAVHGMPVEDPRRAAAGR